MERRRNLKIVPGAQHRSTQKCVISLQTPGYRVRPFVAQPALHTELRDAMRAAVAAAFLTVDGFPPRAGSGGPGGA